MMNVEIAQRLAELRRERGFSQESLAEQLGLSRQAVSKWERAESAPDMGNLIALADLYGVTLDELLRVSPEVEEDVRYESQERAESAESQAAEAAEAARAAAERAETAAVAASAAAAEGEGTQKVVVEVSAPAPGVGVSAGARGVGAAMGAGSMAGGMPGVAGAPAAPPYPQVASPGGPSVPGGMPGGAMPGYGAPQAPVPPVGAAPFGGSAPIPPAATVPIAPPARPQPKDPLRSFPYPLLCAVLFLLAGFCFGWWHPGWIIFLTIPFYYWIVGTLESDPAYREWVVERGRAAQDAAREDASSEGGAR